MFLDAVEYDDTLRILMPTTDNQLKTCADAWNSLSGAFGVYYGVVGAIDGWLACIEKPTVSNDTHYFSGHYQQFDMNIQAVCDANLRDLSTSLLLLLDEPMMLEYSVITWS